MEGIRKERQTRYPKCNFAGAMVQGKHGYGQETVLQGMTCNLLDGFSRKDTLHGESCSEERNSGGPVCSGDKNGNGWTVEKFEIFQGLESGALTLQKEDMKEKYPVLGRRQAS